MRLAASLLALAAVALAGPSPANAGWTHERVAATDTDYGNVALATNQRGDAALLFDTSKGLSLALARPGRNFGRPRAVPKVGDDSSIGVAVDERGNVLVVWNYNDHSIPARPFDREDDCCERVRVALLRAGSKRFSGPKTFGRRGRDSFLGAFSLVNGRVGVAWSENNDVVVARLSRHGLDFRPALRVAGYYALAVNPLTAGPVLTFLRYRYDPERSTLFDLVLRRRHRPALRKIFSRHADLTSIDVASNSRGDQALAWYENTRAGRSRVFAAARSPGGLVHPRLLARRALATGARVAIARDGAAIAGWDDLSQVFTAARRRGGDFGHSMALSPPRRGLYVDDVQVAAGPGGRGVVAWRASTASTASTEHVALRTRGGRMLSPRSFGHVTNYASSDTTALDSHGVGRVTWANGPPYAARARFPAR